MELATIRDMAITASTTDLQTATQSVEPRSRADTGTVTVSTDSNLWSLDCNFTSTCASGNELLGYFAVSHSNVASIDQSNQQYSIYAITDTAGAVSKRYAYTAYGQPTILAADGTTSLTTSAVNNRYTYTAREWDSTIGLYHFRARWMSSLTGRFLTRDPIGYEGSPENLYEYLEGRSLIHKDPTGHGIYADCKKLWDILWKQKEFAEKKRPIPLPDTLIGPKNCEAICLAWAGNGSQASFCALLCKNVVKKDYSCKMFGQLCKTFRTETHLKNCLGMCESVCPHGDCIGF